MINILFLHAGAEMYGADIVMLEILKGIDKNKFKPYVILPCQGPLYENLKNNKIEVDILNYPILRRKYFNFKGIINYLISFIKNTRKLKSFCKEKSIQIVHSNTSAVLEGAFLKKILNIKHVWHIHEIILSPNIVYKVLCFLISRYSDKQVVVSKAAYERLIQSKYFNNKNNKIEIIYNGVNNKKFNPSNEIGYLKKEFNIENDDIIVGMIGRVNSWKGQKDFICALEKVISNNYSVKAVLIGGTFHGEEWRYKELENIIRKSKYKDNFIINDFRKDTPNIHNLFDIFVLPSVNPDPLPTVVLEAMAAGKPIIAYRHGGVTEMVKENYNGLFSEVRNIDDLAKKIEELVSDKEKRIKMGFNSIHRQQEMFSMENFIVKFTDLYIDLVL